MEKLKMKLIAEEFEREEFYEEIEAPKFVDLTLPDQFIPDDRYWFCSRVGCDLKHEQEVDLEAIYKNFALRAMAARSPNMKLRKILSNRQSESRKCPLSAPPKSSKSRIPKLPLLSSVSRKLIDAKEATKPPPKPGPTPKARVKHVAAKYMTTPRVKKPPSDAIPFKSVRNQTTASSRIPRQKLAAAKALNFTSPKKIVRAKAPEDQGETTPVKKLCDGMKKLEMTDKKKGANGELQRSCKKKNGDTEEKWNSSRCLTSKTKGSVRRKAKPVLCEAGAAKPESDEGITGSSDGASDEASLSASNSSQESVKERVLVESGSLQVGVQIAENNNKDEGSRNDQSSSGDEKENAPVSDETPLSTSNSSQESAKERVLVESEGLQVYVQIAENNKKNEGSGNDQSSRGDEKENAPVSDINRDLAANNGESGIDLGVKHEAPRKTKVALTEGKSTLKENRSAAKHKKQKTTNPKPFRLRTDERRILKEATLERKQQLDDENQIPVSKTEGKMHTKSKKNQVVSGCKSQNKDGQNKVKSSARLPFLQISDQRATQRLKVSRPNLPEGEKAINSHGKRPITIPETPKFHALHVPRSCTKNIEKGIA